MSIAILNYSFLTPQHIEHLKKFGMVIEYSTTVGESEAIKRLRGIEIAIADCADIPFTQKVFQSSSSLKYLCLNSSGYEQVDIQAAKEAGVIVSNIPDYSTDSVAEHTIGLILALAHHIPLGDKAMREKPFEIDLANKHHYKYLGQTIKGKTLGIIGLGKIGCRVAKLGNAFGMKVIAFTRFQKKLPGVTIVNLDEILKDSDFISINSAYEERFKNMLDYQAILKMKPTVMVVNTARGNFINEKAIVTALRSKKIAGYASDFISDYSEHNPLLKFDNVVLTPHLGFFSEQSIKKLTDTIITNVEAYINNNPINIIK